MAAPWWHGKVAYQIYPKSFCDSNGDGMGDLPGVRSKLDYLKELGVDLLWLSPVYVSPMVDQGYDIADYRQIDPRFGTMEDMEALIRESKKRGMALIMDLVVNHCSDQHPWFQAALRDPEGRYGRYFYFKEGVAGGPPNNWRSAFGGSCWEPVPGRNNLYYFHTFAKEQPDLNWEHPELRREICDMVNWWLDKGISGFRVDAIINIKKDLSWRSGPPDSPDGTCSVFQMLPKTREIGAFLGELKETCLTPHGAFTVGEVFDITRDRLPEFGGAEGYFSTLFDFEHCLVNQTGVHWYQHQPVRFGPWREAVFRAQEEAQRGGVYPANLIENHDQPRGASYFIPAEDYGFHSVTALATLSLLLRGIPFLYQGQELGMCNYPFASPEEFDDLSTREQYARALAGGRTPEQALAVCAQYSRDNARTPMQWTGGAAAGFTTGTPWLPVNPNYPTVNAEAEQADPNSVLAYYKKLIALRKDPALAPVLAEGAFAPAYREEKSVFAYRRIAPEASCLVLCNYAAAPCELAFAQPVGRVLLNNYPELAQEPGSLHLKPYQAVVLEQRGPGVRT
ncbi:MAG TPA: alpha-glucosidase [Candidatus Flavonifractor intestinipullorum]|uniref:Alpha-glucosidase n=1 Tax=Candidatus Flavonifractor intestinipullorum TaxID=2838587 RepID=A0A9D2S5M5_9FIRM|nr:alpha-glucosidase [Candidatus Flavonifractor intestinipullorum]